MYIGGTGKEGLHHLLWELVDNAVDEATNGHASRIVVTLHPGGTSATVTDNGRGIPVDNHPVKKLPALQVILTTLHSGGKFDGRQYQTAGGLHGVGASVVNALSERLVATVKRDGKRYEQQYRRGEPVTALKVVSRSVRGSGTSIFFEPDTLIFEKVAFDSAWIAEQLETKTYLNSHLRIVFDDRVTGSKHEFVHVGGIRELLDRLIREADAAAAHAEQFFVVHEMAEEGARLEVALQWTEATNETVRSFVNGIPTHSGGTHVQGLRDAVRQAVRSFMKTHKLLPRNLNVSSDDIREGLFAVVNMFMAEPQFQGQTKEKLNNQGARSLVKAAVRMALEQFLNAHPTASDAIVARVIQSARARKASHAAARQVRTAARKRRRLNLPGKLADCSSSDPVDTELFIVEGDSAGGSAKQGRDRRFQAVLPLRGKVLNAEQATLKRVLANTELSNVTQALGCGVGERLDLTKLRYHKVILLMDADSDGHHIATLLLTFLYRHMRPLIDGGHVFVAEPPLYRLNAGKKTFWARDDAHRKRISRRLRKRRPNVNIEVQRFKGLGEMMPATLRDTTLHPRKRRLLRVEIPPSKKKETDRVIAGLMGRDASVRYRFIMENAVYVDDLDV